MGRWLIASAWPYINYVPHLGTMIGSILSADVFARFLRMLGEEVLFVSGSDEHGTPIEVEAIKRGIDPKKFTDENHKRVKELFAKWNISFDNYTRTENPIHKEFVRKFYMKLYERGYIFSKEIEMPYCPKCRMFLPDRFIEGTCPYCGYPKARGDQCDRCGRLLEPTLLINPRCSICGSKPEIKRTLHWFFDLPKLTDKIKEYIENNKNLPDNARNMSLSMIREGLKPRSLTRDNKWGIPAPFPGAEGKTIYVWMEAVLGYVSATIEYFVKRGDPDGWKKYWFDPEVKSVFFIGKDNIPFHTIIFPALLLASGDNYVLPWRVESTEYLMFEGEKFSKSRRIGIWIDEALEILPSDYWRFALVYIRPETRDSNFTWDLFIDIINSILNDTIGNFIHRTLSLTYRHFKEVPPRYKLNNVDEEVLNDVKRLYEEITKMFKSFKFKEALFRIVDIARVGNKYLNDTQPWDLIKTNRERVATVLNIALGLVKALAILLAPIIPEHADRLWHMLGYKDSVHDHKWQEALTGIKAGQKIEKPKPLFTKVSKEQITKLTSRPTTSNVISIEEFSRLDLRVGKVLKASKVPNSDKLLELMIDIGGEVKRAIAGIGEVYEPKELIGKKVVVLCNIKPKKIRGITSEVMILAACNREGPILIVPERDVKEGTRIS